MIANLDLIRTVLEGLRESMLARISSTAAGLERKLSAVEAKIQTPDYAAAAGQNGYIKNKPALTGRTGAGEAAEVFNDYEENAASGLYAHAEGSGTTASGDYGSHAEGSGTTASGRWGSHAEGFNTVASGTRSHAEGGGTVASGMDSHAEGYATKAASQYQHVQGIFNVEDRTKKYAHIVGNGTQDSARSNAHTLDWNGNAWFAGGVRVGGTGQDDGEAEALLTAGAAGKLFAAADAPVFTGSVSMGRKADSTVGPDSTALGWDVTADGDYAHAEGRDTVASDTAAHAEGQGTQATGAWSHAEGYESAAEGIISHAEGSHCTAKGYASHAEGQYTVAASDYQHVQGRYNVEDAAYKYLYIVGNGTAEDARSNAHTLDWAGNAWFAGSLEGTALILKSSGGKYFKLTVNDSGALQAAELLR